MSKKGSVRLINTNIDNSKRIVSFKESKSVNKNTKGSSKVPSIMLVIFITIFVIAVSRVLLGSAPLTFRGFLDSLLNCPSVDISTNIIKSSIVGSWGVFDFLRVFINSFIEILNVSGFIIGLLVNLLLVLLWVVAFLFGF